MNVPFNDLSRIHTPLKDRLDEEWHEIMQEGSFILGRRVLSFERNFAQFCGQQDETNATGVSNGTDGLELLLRAHNIGAGDEVITVSNTFNATVSAIVHTGAKPILIDNHPQTYLFNVEGIEKRITPQTRALMPVHLYGQQADMEKICSFAKERGLLVFEDACQAHGSLQKGNAPGRLSNGAVFSFYPGKNLGGFGDGGMVVSKDQAIIEKLKRLRNYGQRIKYHHDELGFNRRLDWLQAAVLDVKLPFLTQWNEERRKIANTYQEGLQNIPELTLPSETEDNLHVYHLFVIGVSERERVMHYLAERGIETGIHYPVPIHQQKSFEAQHLLEQAEHLQVCERTAKRVLSLPIFPGMKESEVRYVIDAIKSFYQR